MVEELNEEEFLCDECGNLTTDLRFCSVCQMEYCPDCYEEHFARYGCQRPKGGDE